MAVELATGYVNLVPSARGFAGRLQGEVRGAGTVAGKQIGDELDNSLSGRLNGVLRGLGAFAAKASLVLGAAGAALAGWGLKSAASLQQTQIAFEGIFGSASMANDFLAELRKFAARTPFEFPELATASKQLLAVGFAAGDVIPVMTKIGNVAATLGVGADGVNSVIRALGQMKGKGKASAEELQQISEAIPGFSAIGAIAQSMGISTSEAFAKMAAGAIPADQAINAILEGMERFPGAAGAMQRQSQTLMGVLSTFKDTARDALVQGLAPVLPALSTSIQDAMPALSAALTSLGTTFGKLLGALMPMLGALLPVFARIAEAVSGALTQAFDALAPAIASIGPYLGAFFDAVGPLIGQLARALAPILAKLGPAFLSLGTSIATILLPVFKAIGPVITPLAEIFAKLVQIVGMVIRTVGPALATIAKVIAGSLLKVLEALKPSLPAISRAFSSMATAVAELVVALVPIIPPLARIATLLITQIGVPAILGIARAFTTLVTAITPLVSVLADGLAGALDLIAGLIKPIGGLFQGLASAVQSALGFIVGVISDIATAIAGIPGIISSAVGAVFNAAKSIGNAIKDGIVSVINGAISVVVDIADAIWRMFKGAWNGLVNVINDAIPNKIAIPFAPDIQLPDNPFNFAKLATGGLTTGPTMALIGEGKSDEAVLPLDPFWARLEDMLAQPGSAATVVQSDGGVHFHGPVYGMRDFEEKVGTAIQALKKSKRID